MNADAQAKKRNPATTLTWVGLIVTILPQVIPPLLTILGLGYAFTQVQGNDVDPAIKAERLSDSVSLAMEATKWFDEYGLWVSAVGILMLVIAFIRRKAEHTRAD